MKPRLLIYIFLIVTCIPSLNSQVLGQKSINLSTGYGVPEVLNFGLRYQANQSQTGISVGFLPVPGKELISISGDYFYHFGGHSKLSSRRPWYARLGLNYWDYEDEDVIQKTWTLNSRVGRDINFSKNIGISLDLGLALILSSETIDKQPHSTWFDSPVLPSLGIGLYYRIMMD